MLQFIKVGNVLLYSCESTNSNTILILALEKWLQKPLLWSLNKNEYIFFGRFYKVMCGVLFLMESAKKDT